MFSLCCIRSFHRLRSSCFVNQLQIQLAPFYATDVWTCLLNKTELQRNYCKLNTNNKNFNMKLDTPEFKSIFTQALCQLSNIFRENSFEIRIAGGAVRDLLLGIKPKDIDFATTATPDEMKIILEKNGVRMINNRGERHGTITARIMNENFEVTTLRIDVLTDGRHAQVEFTTDWVLDANRRDLTINSMFLGIDGTLYDYFNGYNDLMQRKVAFVGDPEKRIKEDYLRILRYFRFFGRITLNPDKHDPECLRVIKENASELKNISGERVWLELQQIVVGNFGVDIMKTMHKVGIFPTIGLPIEPNITEFEEVMGNMKNVKTVNPITCIAALLNNVDQMLEFHSRCKLSGFERDLGIFLISKREEKLSSLQDYKKLMLYTRASTVQSKEWVIELMKYRSDMAYIQDMQSWVVPRFPLSGRILLSQGVPAGKKLGLVIESLRVLWIKSEFKLTAEELQSHLPEVLSELDIKK